MSALSLVFAAIGGCLLGWFFARGGGGGRRAWPPMALIYDGSGLQLVPCRQDTAGVVVGDCTYPAGILRRVDVPGLTLYLVAAQPVPLADHQTLERARRTIALRALFAGGGDIMRYLTIAALVVPLAVSLWMFSIFGGLRDSVARQQADLLYIRDAVTTEKKP